MIVGTGIDVVPISRIMSMWRTHRLRMQLAVFTPGELQACTGLRLAGAEPLTAGQAQYLAERFAGKEAVIKTLGLGSATTYEFSEIEIEGKSRSLAVRLTGEGLRRAASDLGIRRLRGSCSSTHQFSIACIIGESNHGEHVI